MPFVVTTEDADIKDMNSAVLAYVTYRTASDKCCVGIYMSSDV
jgi:hypothetical protein